jgi:hypothetical protein
MPAMCRLVTQPGCCPDTPPAEQWVFLVVRAGSIRRPLVLQTGTRGVTTSQWLSVWEEFFAQHTLS